MNHHSGATISKFKNRNKRVTAIVVKLIDDRIDPLRKIRKYVKTGAIKLN